MRQTDRKLATLSEPAARRYHTPSVRLYEVTHERQTDPQPEARADGRFIRLPEQFKYVREGL
jgi:hypothetical protein